MRTVATSAVCRAFWWMIAIGTCLAGIGAVTYTAVLVADVLTAIQNLPL